MSFDALIPNSLLFLADYKYLLLFLITVIEGPMLMIACGFLIHLGFFELTEAFWVIVAGDLVGDILWYFVGRTFAEPFLRKFGKFFGISLEMFTKAKELFHKYHIKILLISKLTIGFGMALATLVVAGATRIPFKKYLTLNFFGELILVSILLSIGYFFGELYNSISDALKIYFLLGGSMAIILLGFYFIKYAKNAIIN